jgi:PPOX class probable F420-dependent enzyme
MPEGMFPDSAAGTANGPAAVADPGVGGGHVPPTTGGPTPGVDGGRASASTGGTPAGGGPYYALRTFRRDGSGVTTPIWLAPAGGRWYAYTPARSGKVRRVRRDPRVEAARSTFSGEPVGPWRRGRARVLPRAEARTARAALRAAYGRRFTWFRLVTLLGRARRAGGPPATLEITLDAPP